MRPSPSKSCGTVARDRLVPDRPFTYDPAALRGARAILGERRPKPRLIDGPLDESPGGDVELAELLRFFANPVKGFFRALDYTLPWDADELSDAIPVAIDGLGKWAVGERMLDDLKIGRDPDFVIGAEWRRGTLPPGRLGHGFYNLQGGHGGLHGHLRADNCKAIVFLRRPFMGKETASVQFFNADGEAMFKIFVGRDDKGALREDQIARLTALRDRLSTPAAA